MHLPNFKQWTNCHVTRVLFNDDRKAIGVEFIMDGKLASIFVKREVILCGGAVNSAQILMLSGIGLRDNLESLGIKTIVNLPVGQNLQDHIWVPVAYHSLIPFYLQQYANHVETSLFTKTKYCEEGVPDLQILQCNILSGDELLSEKPAQHGFLLIPIVLYPKSHGYITLKSNNPLDPPIIHPNYLDEELDLNILVEGVKICRTLIASKHFNNMRGKEIFPGEHIMTDKDIAKFVIKHIDTLYHPVGTCKMGLKSDPTTVIDPTLKVHGVHGLRVADAAIMPKIVGGNTHAPCVMIGEKAADIILTEQYKSKSKL